MPWVRPDNVPVGQVWSRFKGRTRDGEPAKKLRTVSNMFPRIHPVSGRYVQVSPDGREARLTTTDPSGAGVVFMDRQLRVSDKIYVCVKYDTGSESEVIFGTKEKVIFGFSTENPVTLMDNARVQTWEPTLVELAMSVDNSFCVYAKSSTDIQTWANGNFSMCLSGLAVSNLWLFVRLNNAGHTIRLMELDLPQPMVSHMINLRPLNFHHNGGKAIRREFSKASQVRPSMTFEDCLTFSDRPIEINEKVCMRVIAPLSYFGEPIQIGFTSQDPTGFRGYMDSSKYWVTSIQKESCTSMYFYRNVSGDVYLSVDNGPETRILTAASRDGNIWALILIPGMGFDVYFLNTIFYEFCLGSNRKFTYSPLTPKGSLSNLTLSPGVQSTSRPRLPNVEPLTQRTPIEASPAIDASRNYVTPPERSDENCKICYERPINSVFISCGHMCSCYECGLNIYQGQGQGQCPICREKIKQVQQVFKM